MVIAKEGFEIYWDVLELAIVKYRLPMSVMLGAIDEKVTRVFRDVAGTAGIRASWVI